MLNYLIGVKTKDFVVLGADTVAMQQVWSVSTEDNKFYDVNRITSMVGVGDGGDIDEFGEFVAKNMTLYEMRNGYPLTPKGVASYCRRLIVKNLRTADPYPVHVIIGGWDEKSHSPYLGYLDYLGTLYTHNYLMFGYGSFFCYSIFDNLYEPDMDLESILKIMKMAFAEVKKRFVVNVAELRLQLIDVNGKRDLPNLVMP